ncbi:NAD-glutamate dehydrogenase domain-containing protein [Pseudonocardia asaccharolytica]|uniref:Putative NAD-glutamate dehydrogenase n=1 Tax=Pseudonocardia asaccharolytica DSM 44247 = NBRC 16224 TaxID=1123024 RepID=A0A511CZC9_9PSEU|nr:NAD-glutamate dehydrogenase domain-containing protein [Pseudonocardia asaccharolytica]GEL17827.1 putative NAD-glutamate dehydrogenase [Pseudonocardia asaccharolytica DSM 44247 = NBRC 16224]
MGSTVATQPDVTEPAAGDLAPALRRLHAQPGLGAGPRVAFLAADTDVAGPVCLARWPGRPPLLADIVPLFEQFGLRLAAVIGLPGEDAVRRLDFARPPDGWDAELTTLVEGAFPDAAHPGVVGDPFAKLVVAARLPWRDVELIRAAASYLNQAGLGHSDGYVVATLGRHPRFVRALAALFRARLHPHLTNRPAAVDHARRELHSLLERSTTLDEDRILRGVSSFVDAILRTNWYQRGQDGGPKPYRAFKLDAARLSLRGPDAPLREVFVHAPDVAGIHVRAGLVARGGVRWSDRPEDFRVEVLQLLKTQRVKNAVIVPDGAKGAFVVRGGADPAACYDTFVRGLLDVTDDLVDGEVVTAPDTVAHDGPDPYLVVAADKGTARFSDRANAIAAQRGFWLVDAFASGGSAGYDHKAMGITARGSWVAVRQHLAELGSDPDVDEITVAGIGDMSGDVFGNGMLESRRIRLVAAFDHRHVFLDPDPDPATSYRERERLARLAASSWADYDPALISGGGGVWPRTAKRIELSPQARRRLGVATASLPPDEVIRAILRAPVDLLWNGGIGTYVKAGAETHGEAADPANDTVRVDAEQLRCRVVGEGGNLGVTQRGRIEFARGGGRINGDFIDNAAGVNTSDREVNLKILLAAAESAGELTRAQRDRLLARAADEVAAAVLDDSAQQVLAISLAESQSPFLLDRHARLVRHLERVHGLDRTRDVLPDDEELAARARRGHGLTRPEIAVLLAHSKNVVRADLLASEIPDDPAFAELLAGYFPASLRERLARWVPGHRLAREIVATRLAGDLINHMGPGFVMRMEERFGASSARVAVAIAAVRAVFDNDRLWQAVTARTDVPFAARVVLLRRIQEFVERAAAWLVHRRGPALRPSVERRTLRPMIDAVHAALPGLDGGTAPTCVTDGIGELVAAGCPRDLATEVAALPVLADALDAADVATGLGRDVADVAGAALELDRALELGVLAERLTDVAGASHWESMAISILRDELSGARRAVLTAALGDAAAPGAARVRAWLDEHRTETQRLRTTTDELHAFPRLDAAMAATVVAQLRLLAGPDAVPALAARSEGSTR